MKTETNAETLKTNMKSNTIENKSEANITRTRRRKRGVHRTKGPLNHRQKNKETNKEV